MKKRSERGRGSVYQRADGAWVVAVNLGGKPRKRKVFYSATQEEAERLRAELVSAPREPVEVFWSRVQRGAPDECWPWDKVGGNGYGFTWHEGKYVGAHRAAYELARGSIPEGMQVCHSCDNPLCCNPAHLWLGTNSDNVADRDAKGRQCKGEARSRVVPKKLTAEQVVEIRAKHDGRYGSAIRLAREYGVSATTIYGVIHSRSWAWVGDAD